MQLYPGSFATEVQVARAYDLVALKCHGQAAITNFPISDYEQDLEQQKSVTTEDLVQQLRRQGQASNQNSSMYRGVHKNHRGKWRARFSLVLWRLFWCINDRVIRHEMPVCLACSKQLPPFASICLTAVDANTVPLVCWSNVVLGAVSLLLSVVTGRVRAG